MMCTSVWKFKGAALAGLMVISASLANAGEAGETTFVEFPVETEAVVAATAALFDRVETGAAEPKAKRPVIRLPRLAQQVSMEDAATPENLTQNGALRHLTGYRLDWYPTDRLLGSVDFMGTWDGNRNLVCGYLTWDVSDPTAPVLQTVVAHYLDIDVLDDAEPAVIHETLLEANCAFGAIEANFGFFDPTG